MFFELQHGVHLEGGIQYKTKYEADKEGVMQCVGKAIVESPTDLVRRFGPEKFRRLSDEEAKEHLKKLGRLAGQGNAASSAKTSQPEPESEVAKAAKEGAVAVLDPPGKDVTGRFPDASGKQLTIYRKDRNQYVVMNGDVCLTEEPIAKKEVDKLIEEWMD